MNVLLVNMPFGSMTRPSLALGLLKSELGAIGVAARVENFALAFAELIGEEDYLYLSDQAAPELLAGEWVFASCLFGDDPARADEYERLVGSAASPAELELIRRARSRADGFLRRCVESVDWRAYDVVGFTTTFACTCSLTSCSTWSTSLSLTPAPCEKSKRRWSGATSEPACVTWVPRIFLRAA